MARGPIDVSAVVSYSLIYHATDVMDNDNLASALKAYSLAYHAGNDMDNDNLVTALSGQIQISIAPIGMVRIPFVEPIVLARRLGITPGKAKKTIQATMKRAIRTMIHHSFFKMIQNKLSQSLLLSPGTSCILRHDICQYSVQKGQQVCISICHRPWMC